jgi:pimeloyl-ACP methyl ester carboxylesterase
MYYEVRGSGPPLLFVPGQAQRVDEVEPLIALLSEHYTVIAMDNRGTGRTTAPPGPYSIEQMADDLLALMNHLEIERAHVLGISMGGRLALALALEHPERVDRLVLASTSARVVYRRTLTKLILLIGQLPGLRKPGAPATHALRAQFAASTRVDCLSRLAEITRPTLVVHGRADPIVPLTYGEEMYRAIPGAHLVLFHGGHRITLEPSAREDVAASVQSFLTAD